MPAIRNQNDLTKLLESQARLALESATEELLDLFKTEYIQKYVYDGHSPNEMYHGGSGKPTGEFMEAWQWTELKKVTNKLITEMWYDPSKLQYDMGTFKHGSKYSTPKDVRKTLMDILNKDGYSSSLWLSVNRPVAYWEQFISDMFASGKLNEIIGKHLILKGFTIA